MSLFFQKESEYFLLFLDGVIVLDDEKLVVRSGDELDADSE